MVLRTGSGGGLVADKAAPQLPQNLLPAEFWRPQLAQFSTSATPQSPQKFLSSGLSLPQFGHRTSVLVCVAVNSPFTSLPRDSHGLDDKPGVRVTARVAQANTRELTTPRRQPARACDYANTCVHATIMRNLTMYRQGRIEAGHSHANWVAPLRSPIGSHPPGQPFRARQTDRGGRSPQATEKAATVNRFIAGPSMTSIGCGREKRSIR